MGGFLSKSHTWDVPKQITKVISITMAGFMSFIARGLASIPGHLFCYSAISSAAIVGILPGYLIRKFFFIPAVEDLAGIFLFSSELS